MNTDPNFAELIELQKELDESREREKALQAKLAEAQDTQRAAASLLRDWLKGYKRAMFPISETEGCLAAMPDAKGKL